jgi:F-type H+-transporting ATPase subunit b
MLQLKVPNGSVSTQFGDTPHVILVQETDAAGEAAGGTTAAEGHEKAGGMPQLNFADFTPQLIWLAVTFVILLIVMSKVALPRIAGVIEQRDARIKGDLDRAEKVKADADAALAAYQKSIADARAKAQAESRQTQAAIAAETAKRDAEFAQALAQQTKKAEDNIAVAKTRALADLRGVSAEVTGSVLGKVAGLSVSAGQLQTAVEAAMTER